ncbi:MAG: DMT family transporter [Actinobacteria bacterium]|nr:DMT family transporter [Actinomycetota bacterium]
MSPRHLALLVLGVAAVSFSSVLIRLADAPPLAIAFYRNGMAAALLLPLALIRHREELQSLTRRQWTMAVLAGALLAAHFALWVPSLSYTSVAASTVLVTTQPVWVALIGRALGQGASRRTLAGIALSLVGAVVLSGGDFGVSRRAAFGDALALLGAVAAAGYFLSGRSVRQRLSLLTYVGIAYTTCAALLAIAMAVAGVPFSGFEAEVWALFALMTVGPQIMGHTVFNYLLRHLEAVVVAVAIMAEPVGATLLALAILGEVPPWTAVVGGAVILVGVYLAVSAQARRQVAAPIE